MLLYRVQYIDDSEEWVVCANLKYLSSSLTSEPKYIELIATEKPGNIPTLKIIPSNEKVPLIESK